MNDIKQLLADLKSKDKPTCWNGSIALHEMGEQAVPFLIEAFKKNQHDSQIASLLSGMRTLAKPAAPLFISFLENVDLKELIANKGPDNDFQYTVARIISALGNIGDAAAVPVLLKFLEDDNYLCQCAAGALGDLKDHRAIVPLIKVLQDKNKSWVPREAAARALRNFGNDTKVLSALQEALTYGTKNSGEKWDERARSSVEESIRYIQSPEQFPVEEKKDRYRGDDPAQEAEQFAFTSRLNGFHFDFSLESLEKEVDRYLEKMVGENGTKRNASVDAVEKLYAAENSLTAYIGETIRRLFGGRWAGPFDNSFSGANYYTFSLMIGTYEFFPSHFVAYYFSNGKESEGTFYDYLHGTKFSEGGLLGRIEKGKL